MSDQELQRIDSNIMPLGGSGLSVEEIKSVLQENIGTGGLSEFKLDRIKMPGGENGVFALPNAEGKPTFTDTFEFTMLGTHEARSYWESGLDESATKTPPDCSSNNAIIGRGRPGGECAKCTYSQFGTGKNGAQACNHTRRVFIYRAHPQTIYPELFIISPASMDNYSNWSRRLSGVSLAKGKLMSVKSVVIRVNLVPATSKGGTKFFKAEFTTVRELTPAEKALRQQLEELFRPLLDKPVDLIAGPRPVTATLAKDQAFE